MFDELINTFREVVRQEVSAATESLQKEIRQLKEADRLSYNLNEAAKNTGIPYDTLRAKCKAGKIKYVQEQEGGSILITREALQSYLDEYNSEQERKTGKVKMKVTST